MRLSPRARFCYYGFPELASTIARDVILGHVKSGNDVSQLEAEIGRMVGAKYALAMPQARIGIFLTLSELTKERKKVLLSPYTIHDVINMVICAGGRPVFVDIERDTCNISPDQIEALIDDDTAAVLITHLHGLACDVERIGSICRARGVPLVEDAAQAFGTRVNDRMVGSFGDVGIFSLGRAKVVNALYGGILVTNRRDLAESISARMSGFPYFPAGRLISQAMICLIANFLFSPFPFSTVMSRILRYAYLHDIDMANRVVRGERDPILTSVLREERLLRMTPMQARLARIQLAEVEKFSRIRRQFALAYHEGLKDIPEILIPPYRNDGSHTYQTFPIQVPDRHRLVRFMMMKGRDVTVQHIGNNADARCFSEYYRDCPNARVTAASALLLPTYPKYSMAEVEKNIACVREYFHAFLAVRHAPTGRRNCNTRDRSVKNRYRLPESHTQGEGLLEEHDQLEKEGSILFRYLLGQAADDQMIRLYVDAVTSQTPQGRPLRLPRLVEWWPPLLRLFEPVKGKDAAGREDLLKTRLRCACFIADAKKAPLFYDYQDSGLIQSWIRLTILTFVEGAIMPCRLIFKRWWRW